MKTRECPATLLLQKIAILVLALALSLAFVSVTRAEAPSRFQPGSLMLAEQALAEGQPGRALSALHRQRAILSHSRFRPQAEALACQAYLQLQDLRNAAQVCEDVVAYDGDPLIAEAYEPPVD